MKLDPKKVFIMSEEDEILFEESFCNCCGFGFEAGQVCVKSGNKKITSIKHLDCLGSYGNRNFVQDIQDDGRWTMLRKERRMFPLSNAPTHKSLPAPMLINKIFALFNLTNIECVFVDTGLVVSFDRPNRNAPHNHPTVDQFTSLTSAIRRKLKGSSTSHSVLKVALVGKKVFTPSALNINLFSSEKQANNKKGGRV